MPEPDCAAATPVASAAGGSNSDRAAGGRRRPGPPPGQGVKLIFELTNLCNFSCVHGVRSEEGGKGFLSVELVEKVLREVEPYGMVDLVAFTGGEPTLHPEFERLCGLVAGHDYRLAMVTNGSRFGRALPVLVRLRERVANVTFSLDGAIAATHDGIRRRPGSFREVIAAILQCRHHGIEVQVNMTVTRANREELREMALLASSLDCQAVGYAHCQPTADAIAGDLVMNAAERLAVEADIAALQRQLRIELYLAGDHHTSSRFHQCSQLRMREFNIDYRGYLTACCLLSSYRGGAADSDVVADLNQVDFAAAHRALIDSIAAINREKTERLVGANTSRADGFMCSHCLLRYRKVPDLEAILYPPSPPPGEE